MRAVQDTNWKELYESGNFASTLERWRNEWKADYDFILIDSRTGITDIGALCTVFLPDVLVAFCSANWQSIMGTKDVAQRSAEARNRLPLDRAALPIVPVLSRFESREEYELALEWRQTFARECVEFCQPWLGRGVEATKILDRITIPYVPYWTFGERVAAMEEESRGGESLRLYLETLAALLGNRLASTALLAENAEGYIEQAIRAGRERSEGLFDILLFAASGMNDRLGSIEDALVTRGFRVAALDSSQVSVDDLNKRFAVQFKGSRHVVMLLDRRARLPEMDLLRQGARWILEDGSDRVVLPLVLGDVGNVRFGSILEGLKRVLPADSTIESIAELIGDVVRHDRRSSSINSEQGYIRQALELLRSEDALTRESALRVLVKTDSPNRKQWISDSLNDPEQAVRAVASDGINHLDTSRQLELYQKLSRDKDSSLRQVAAEGLARLASPSAFNTLLYLLSDDDSGVRLGATRGIAASSNTWVPQWLLPRVNDLDKKVQLVAVSSLIERGDPELNREVLRRADTNVVQAAIRTLGVTAIRAILESEVSADVKRVGIRRLAEAKDLRALNILLGLLGFDDVRSDVLAALKDFDLPFAVQQIDESLTYVSGVIKAELIRLLGAYQQNRVAAERVLVRELHGSLDDSVARLAAVEALGTVGSQIALSSLAQFLRDDDPAIRGRVVWAMSQIGVDSAEEFQGMLHDPSKFVRKSVVSALGSNPVSRGEHLLVDFAIDDSDDDVRTDAMVALSQLNPKAVEHLHLHPESAVRVSLAKALPRVKGIPAREILSQLLLDRDRSVRLAAITVVGQRPDCFEFDQLFLCLDDEDDEIRSAATGAFAQRMEQPMRRILSQDLDGVGPWWDPKVTVSEVQVHRAARHLGQKIELMRRLFEDAAGIMKGHLRLSWKDS